MRRISDREKEAERRHQPASKRAAAAKAEAAATAEAPSEIQLNCCPHRAPQLADCVKFALAFDRAALCGRPSVLVRVVDYVCALPLLSA